MLLQISEHKNETFISLMISHFVDDATEIMLYHNNDCYNFNFIPLQTPTVVKCHTKAEGFGKYLFYYR